MKPAWRAIVLLLGMLLLSACMPSRQDIRSAQEDVRALQDHTIHCDLPNRCAQTSGLYDLAAKAEQRSAAGADAHEVVLLEGGQDALLARLDLIRAARQRIDMQSFIYAEDDAGFLVWRELLQAARRGVQVRVLLDQLFSVEDATLIAELARAHVNFELRLYNPTFGKAYTGKLDFFAGILCCFTRFNQRMHNKLLLVDGRIGITGGRNYQDRYFDWDRNFNYRDRDIIVAGPAAGLMQESFDLFWQHQRSVPVAALRDVRPRLRQAEGPADLDLVLGDTRLREPERVHWISALVEHPEAVSARLSDQTYSVGEVEFISDRPNKTLERNHPSERELSSHLLELFNSAEQRILLQTPYLVFSRTAQKSLRALQKRPEPPRVIVSTNSLASTDAFPVYALSHKYKRRYLREFGLHIHEYKPFPGNAPIDRELAVGTPQPEPGPSLGEGATEARRSFVPVPSAIGSGAGAGAHAGSVSGSAALSRGGRVPLSREGMRMGMHAKSLVIDERIGMVGTHNFDPRSDRLNTESAVIVHDADFARALAHEILADTTPENAWVIAPRRRPPVLSGLNYSVGKAFEYLPLFDIWPFRYATSWDMKPGCAPVPRDDPRFAECYEPVGDFPEVNVPFKSIYTRILTAFGAGLAPIL